MWKWIVNRIHHALDPHCGTCALDAETEARCKSCEVYQQQLDIASREKLKLLEIIMELNSKRIPETVKDEKDFKPIQPKFVPWHIERARLEQESRERSAELLRKRNETPTDDLDVKALEELVLGDSHEVK
jgi:hypothetical protein